MDLATIFNQFAFPVAVVMALMYYVITEGKAHREQLAEKDRQITELTKRHSDESTAFTEALNRNTVVLERLCTLMGDRGTTDAAGEQ